MNPEFSPVAPVDTDSLATDSLATGSPFSVRPPLPLLKNRVARWRWWVSLAILILLPLAASILSAQQVSKSPAPAPLLPKSVLGLLIFCALNLVEFGVVWTLAWAFSRANRDQLFLRWRGFKSVLWGVGYSLLMRFGLVLVAILVVMVLAMLGFDSKAMMETMKASGDNVQKLFAPIFTGRDPLHKFLIIGLISFVAAGLREELWRAATLAAMIHLAPRNWSQATKNGVALGLSSALFGLGHLYQGATGVVGTGILGVALGAIMLRHKSVWPAIIAHGCFDAVSFAALAFGAGAK